MEPVITHICESLGRHDRYINDIRNYITNTTGRINGMNLKIGVLCLAFLALRRDIVKIQRQLDQKKNEGTD